MPQYGVLAVVCLPLPLLLWLLLLLLLLMLMSNVLCPSHYSGLPFAGLESVPVRWSNHLFDLIKLSTGSLSTLNLHLTTSQGIRAIDTRSLRHISSSPQKNLLARSENMQRVGTWSCFPFAMYKNIT